jgi:hypothetical protein
MFSSLLVKSTVFEQYIAYYLMRTFVICIGRNFLLGTETTENVEDRVGVWGGIVKERTQNGGGKHLENVYFRDRERDGRIALIWAAEEWVMRLRKSGLVHAHV